MPTAASVALRAAVHDALAADAALVNILGGAFLLGNSAGSIATGGQYV